MIHKIIIFLFLFISGGAIIIIGTATYFYLLFIVILAGCFLLSRKKLKASVPTLRNIFYMGVFFTALLLLRGESSATFAENGTTMLKFVILLIFSIYVTTFFESNQAFFTKLVSVFEFLLMLSVATFVLTNVLPGFFVNVGAKNTVTGDQFETFFGIAYARSGDFAKYKFYRNQSIFWEPGVYGAFITCVYIIKVFYLKQTNRLYWYYLTILSTLAMGGVTVFFALVISKFFFSGSDKQFSEKLPALAILIGIPLFAIVDFVYSYSTDIALVIGAIFKRNISSDTSIGTRYQDLYYGFLAAKNKIWLGHGLDYTDYYKITTDALNTSKESYNGGITNAIVDILYCYGIFYLIYYVILMFKSVKTLTSNSRYALLALFAFIGVLMLEPIHFALFMIFIFTFRESKKTALT